MEVIEKLNSLAELYPFLNGCKTIDEAQVRILAFTNGIEINEATNLTSVSIEIALRDTLKKQQIKEEQEKLKELKKINNKKYYEKNKADIVKKQTEYNKNHKEEISQGKQSYYQRNRELILNKYHSTWKERRSLKQQGIKDIVVCKECNKEYLRSNLARHVSKIHPWIINYKEGH
jgi:hypothetical protein